MSETKSNPRKQYRNTHFNEMVLPPPPLPYVLSFFSTLPWLQERRRRIIDVFSLQEFSVEFGAKRFVVFRNLFFGSFLPLFVVWFDASFSMLAEFNGNSFYFGSVYCPFFLGLLSICCGLCGYLGFFFSKLSVVAIVWQLFIYWHKIPNNTSGSEGPATGTQYK